ncbi:sugar phosphate isomerase/epimerase [Sandaracinomonas limnophila]|uniref:Sugar phosphate isomerase/epimerase n=1 Tax=Sandaracinomonas limnophila TaxID=1862386 RepID=A0A437PXN5_9BACT|nr:sugar phosphate isomerase/epimerase family protein [Sandaracinomonas limnophila]RVU27000.1 sugar phosphate isomerase/epimerase [Sandaracinomonas limnophila]
MKYKLAMNTLVYGPDMNESIIKHLAYIKEVGYEGVEIPIFETDLAYWEPWKKEIDRLGLTVFTVTFLGADKNTISSDPAIRQNGIDFLKKAVDVTAYLGASFLSGPYHSALGVFSGAAPTQQELDWSKESMLAVADHADKMNVTLGLEYLNRFENYVVSSADQLYSLVKAINHPRVKIMFDTFHAHIEEFNTGKAMVRIADEIVHVQLSESTRATLGEGQVHWDNVFEGLKEMNYQGWLVVEAFTPLLPAACIWRKNYTTEEELILKSYEHIRRCEG